METRVPFWGFSKQREEEGGLRTERQIALYRQREAARRERAERREVEAQAREAEARVRHLNFELIQRAVLLAIGVGIGIAVVVGALTDPELLKLSLVAASAWGAIATALYQRGSRGRER